MGSATDAGARALARARVLAELRARLEQARGLSDAMRAALARSDAARIEEAWARLETVYLEFRLLAGEHDRLGEGGEGDAALELARRELETEAERLARSAAVAGGVADRVAALRRGLLSIAAAAARATYRPEDEVAALGNSSARWRSTA